MVNNKEDKQKQNYTFKVIKNGKVVKMCRTKSKRRFLHHARTINWKESTIKVYLRVYYGKHKDVHGKLSSFHNDGWYDNKAEFWLALNAFLEE